jgi:threonine dehydrogenase-like Zn-dependent dehydrogenase
MAAKRATYSALTPMPTVAAVTMLNKMTCSRAAGCGLRSHSETTQNRAQGKGASLFGYTKLYGHVPGGQAEYLRVSQPQFGPIKVPEGPPDDRFVYLSGILPTGGWRADRVHGGLLLS